ncbi:metalloregulator ArsR/SmtB family transcription factor [Salmonella enterica subsp. enterica serovar Agona]|nr:metalloregulator ArsR/SmtB family transcription factor [Salmonella enterica subsp. enterica serovar Agona]
MSNRSIKQQINEHLAEIAQAIGHANRLEILEYLAQGQHTVEELTILTGLSFANTSRHLQILRRAKLVQTERKGKYILYCMTNQDEVVTLLRALGVVGERNWAEIQKIMDDYFNAQDELKPISREELLLRLQEGDVTLLDVRPEHEFNLGHLPQALNIPLKDLQNKLTQLPKHHEIIAYCRGAYCVLSVEAIKYLQEQGFKVRRLEDGFPEWKAAGLAVEQI